MHSEYLNELFLKNSLSRGHCHVLGHSIALIDIAAPLLVVGTDKDHVSPWKSVYKIFLQTETDQTFILASGGHNAGIVSPPGDDRPERLGDLGVPARLLPRIRTVRLQRELLQDEPAGGPHPEDTAGHVAGTDVNC